MAFQECKRNCYYCITVLYKFLLYFLRRACVTLDFRVLFSVLFFDLFGTLLGKTGALLRAAPPKTFTVCFFATFLIKLGRPLLPWLQCLFFWAGLCLYLFLINMFGGYLSLGTLSYVATKDLPICRLTRLDFALLTSFYWHSSGLILLINHRAYYLSNKISNHFDR